MQDKLKQNENKIRDGTPPSQSLYPDLNEKERAEAMRALEAYIKKIAEIFEGQENQINEQ